MRDARRGDVREVPTRQPKEAHRSKEKERAQANDVRDVRRQKSGKVAEFVSS